MRSLLCCHFSGVIWLLLVATVASINQLPATQVFSDSENSESTESESYSYSSSSEFDVSTFYLNKKIFDDCVVEFNDSDNLHEWESALAISISCLYNDRSFYAGFKNDPLYQQSIRLYCEISSKPGEKRPDTGDWICDDVKKFGPQAENVVAVFLNRPKFDNMDDFLLWGLFCLKFAYSTGSKTIFKPVFYSEQIMRRLIAISSALRPRISDPGMLYFCDVILPNLFNSSIGYEDGVESFLHYTLENPLLEDGNDRLALGSYFYKTLGLNCHHFLSASSYYPKWELPFYNGPGLAIPDQLKDLDFYEKKEISSAPVEELSKNEESNVSEVYNEEKGISKGDNSTACESDSSSTFSSRQESQFALKQSRKPLVQNSSSHGQLKNLGLLEAEDRNNDGLDFLLRARQEESSRPSETNSPKRFIAEDEDSSCDQTEQEFEEKPIENRMESECRPNESSIEYEIDTELDLPAPNILMMHPENQLDYPMLKQENSAKTLPKLKSEVVHTKNSASPTDNSDMSCLSVIGGKVQKCCNIPAIDVKLDDNSSLALDQAASHELVIVNYHSKPIAADETIAFYTTGMSLRRSPLYPAQSQTTLIGKKMPPPIYPAWRGKQNDSQKKVFEFLPHSKLFYEQPPWSHGKLCLTLENGISDTKPSQEKLLSDLSSSSSSLSSLLNEEKMENERHFDLIIPGTVPFLKSSLEPTKHTNKMTPRTRSKSTKHVHDISTKPASATAAATEKQNEITNAPRGIVPTPRILEQFSDGQSSEIKDLSSMLTKSTKTESESFSEASSNSVSPKELSNTSNKISPVDSRQRNDSSAQQPGKYTTTLVDDSSFKKFNPKTAASKSESSQKSNSPANASINAVLLILAAILFTPINL